MSTDPPLTTQEAATLFNYSVQVFRRIMRTSGSPRPILLNRQYYLWKKDELTTFINNRRARLAARRKR